jgi:hypothetical protein
MREAESIAMQKLINSPLGDALMPEALSCDEVVYNLCLRLKEHLTNIYQQRPLSQSYSLMV